MRFDGPAGRRFGQPPAPPDRTRIWRAGAVSADGERIGGANKPAGELRLRHRSPANHLFWWAATGQNSDADALGFVRRARRWHRGDVQQHAERCRPEMDVDPIGPDVVVAIILDPFGMAGLARGGASGPAPTQKRRLLRQGRFGEMLQKRRLAAREFIKE
jgi:hypothetical protein